MDAKRHLKGSEAYDYELGHCRQWWSFWKFPEPPLASLPQNMLMVYNESVPVAAGFIYQTDSNIAWLEWIVADPKAEKKVRQEALDTLIGSGKIVAQMLGHDVVFTCSKNQSLSHKLSKTMTRADDGVSHFIWRK